MPSAASALEREAEHLAQVYAQLPLEIVSASGVFLHTGEGRRILDLYGGHAVASLGYAHPRVVETLRRQAETLTFQSNAVALDVRARAARRLLALAPDELERVFFVNSGAEANENALRLAFHCLAERDHVVAVENGFHGRTAAAGAVTWGAAGKWYGFPRAPFRVTFVPRDDVAALGRAIGERTAAVIVEPIQGIAGAVPLAPAFLEATRTLTRERGAILIFDEVQCGVGRAGTGFASSLYDVVPDLITTAKALGAGFPVGAVLMTRNIASTLGVGDLGTTFGGGPLACALIEAVLETIEQERLLDNVRRLSDLVRQTCVVGPVEGIQGAGFLLGLRCRSGAARVRDELLRRDILTGTSSDPNVLRLLPPFVLEEEHVGQLAAAL
ncbi:MAG TPA: aminotransferase class III-fold pyridoxal phosphate-dependent enzyme, partial [Vicinamibacteria bacterium]|nr:aminotransferase class III-fold pyridoxal phosphate-dependent enzyme [Vicinamibacteria bacterium]